VATVLLGGSPPFCVCVFVYSSGWPKRLGSAYHCLKRRCARVIPSLGCGPFGTVLVWMVKPVFSLSMGFLRVHVSVFCVVLLICFLCSIICPTSCGEVEKSARADKAIVRTGVAMSLSTPFETGLVFDPGPQPG